MLWLIIVLFIINLIGLYLISIQLNQLNTNDNGRTEAILENQSRISLNQKAIMDTLEVDSQILRDFCNSFEVTEPKPGVDFEPEFELDPDEFDDDDDENGNGGVH